jgi:hypothetical protein
MIRCASLVLALVLVAPISAQQPEPSAPTSQAQNPAGTFRYERAVSGAAGQPQRLPIDVPLLSGGRPFTVVRRGSRPVAEGGLADLRFFDANGREVPYLLVPPPTTEPRWLRTSVLAIAATEKTSGFEADLGSMERVDAIAIEGLGTPFLKRLTLEGSGDRRHWTMLAAEGTLFDLPAEGRRQTSLEFEPGPYRFFRVVWNDANSGRVALPPSVQARVAAETPLLPVTLVPADGFGIRPSEPGRSRFRIRLPAARLPAVALRLDAAGEHILRDAYVTEQRVHGSEASPAVLGRARLTRVVKDGVPVSDLRIPIAAPTETEIDLVVDDGDNPPLGVTEAHFELADLPSIYLESKGVPIVARFGNRHAQAPSYDLEAARNTIAIDKVAAGEWGALSDAAGPAAASAPSADQPATGGSIDPAAFRYSRPIRAGQSGLVALALDAPVLAHSRGPARRFEDVRVVDPESRQIPYLVERLEGPLPFELIIERATSRVPDLAAATGRRSIYRIRLPYRTLPDSTLVLTTSARLFRRTVTVGVERPPDRQRRDYYFEPMGTRAWQSLNRETAAPELTVDLHGLDADALTLVVDEGDNSPLSLREARLLLPSYRLRFYRPAATNLRLVYGRDDLAAPQYDLALLAPIVMGAEAEEIVAGTETSSIVGPQAAGIVSPRLFWMFLGAAILVLMAVLFRLVRQTGPASPPAGP